MPSPPRQSLAANLTLAVGVCAACLGLAEAAARWVEAHRPRTAVERYLWDWQAMWNGDFYTIGTASVGWPPGEEINPDGLRDRAHSREKPPRTQRLVFLGDSVTFGDQIPAEAAYPRLLQDLYDRQGQAVEVFNVGLWGWSTRQQRTAYERIVRPYAPDQVVLAVCLNDVAELQNNLARPPAWLAWAHRSSALVRVLLDVQGREIARVEELFEQPQPAHVRAAWARFFDEVRALREAVRADGASFAVMVLPFRFQVLPDAPPARAQQEIAAFCRREALPFLDLLPHLRELGAAGFVDYDHLSPEGTRRVAAVLHAGGWLQHAPSRAALAAGLAEGSSGARALARWRQALAGHPEAAAREAAAWRLGRHALAGPAERQALRAALGDPDAGVRAEAALALGRRADESAKPALLALLTDTSQVARWAAAHALDALPLSASDGDALVPLLGAEDAFVRGFAAHALGRLGPAAAPAVPALVERLREGGRQRRLVARALARVGPPARVAVPDLVRALEPRAPRPARHRRPAGLSEAVGDPDLQVRAEAARALGWVGAGSPEASSALLASLDDEEELLRAMACRALARLGQPAPAVLAALERRRDDPDPRVRGEAGRALASLSRPRS